MNQDPQSADRGVFFTRPLRSQTPCTDNPLWNLSSKKIWAGNDPQRTYRMLNLTQDELG